MAINENLQTVNAGEGVGRKEPSYSVGRAVNWYSHYGEQYGGSLKTKNRTTIEFCSPTPKYMCGENYKTCASMFMAALFTIAKTWKQCKCPLTEKWIKKMWCIDTMEYY